MYSALVLACLAMASGGAALQAEPIVLFLQDGRVLSGEPDPATSPERIWIYRASTNVLLRSSFAWHDVASTEVGGQQLSTIELKGRLIGAALAEPLPPTFPYGTQPHVASQVLPVPDVWIEPRVASLQMTAVLANWDSDATLDGLEVWIQPLDEAGIPVAIGGQLDMTLYGQRALLQPFSQFAVPPIEFPELERASHIVSKRHFGPQGAVYRLEFDSFHPQGDLSLAPEGFLHARLGIPGQGVFEANLPRVLLRPIVPFRDALQLETGRRIFRREWREVGLP
jgi:hypothetical protein